MRREGKPEGLLEPVLVDPTGRDVTGPGQVRRVPNSRLTRLVRKLSVDHGVENSKEVSARSVKGRNDVVWLAAQKAVLPGYIARDQRRCPGPFSRRFFSQIFENSSDD